MSNSDGIIYMDATHGISIGDIQTVLRTGKSDLGSLCTHSGINKWAKFKPFRNSNLGFTINKSQSTPALRSPNRLKAARTALFGLAIPRYSGTDFKTSHSTPWSLASPRGMNNSPQEWYRILDFDGYLHQNFWNNGIVNNKTLFTIFDGTLSVGGKNVMSGDWINFEIQCTEDSDVGLPGTLYPNDFDANKYNLTDDDYVLSKYYMGIGLYHISNDILIVNTGDRMLIHDPDNPDSGWGDDSSIYAMMRVQIPSDSNLPQGNFRAIPLLAEYSTGGSWSSSGFGHLISLNGAYLPLTKVTAINGLSINIGITVNSSSLTIDFSIQNIANHDITVYDLYGFIISGEAMNDDPDGHVQGIPYNIDPYVGDYIDYSWPNTLSGLTNPPNVYLSDRQSENPNTGNPWPDYPFGLCARGYNALTDFRANNPYTANRNLLREGSNPVTWSKTFNYTGDDYGSYSEMYAAIQMCFSITGVNFTQFYYSE